MSAKELPEETYEGPQAALERMYIKEFLLGKGFDPDNLASLPAENIKSLMREACTYASMKLAEVESRAQFNREIHGRS